MKVLAGAFALVATALPSVLALACPACAARADAGTSTFVMVGAMIAVPYAVSMVAIQIIRRFDGPTGPATGPAPGPDQDGLS